MNMDTTYTERGFKVIEFEDMYERKCNIQKSSLATDEAIWIGIESTRMHLSQEQIKELLPILQIFADTGEI